MTSSTSKKVLILRFDREPAEGFISPQTFLQSGGVELLGSSGSVSVVPYAEIKIICFIRDFGGSTPDLSRKQFASRPKTAGLWLRVRFRDGDWMEGLLQNDLLQLDPYGFSLTPPDRGAASQRVYVPRAALDQVHVLGVVGAQARPRAGKRRPEPLQGEQLQMFE